MKRGRKPKLYTWDGHTATLAEHAKRIGKTVEQMRHLVRYVPAPKHSSCLLLVRSYTYEKVCKCGVPFTGTRARKHCSKACWPPPANKGRRVSHPCRVCSAPIISPCRRYCSKECKKEARPRKPPAERKARQKKPVGTHVCVQCSTSFQSVRLSGIPTTNPRAIP